MVMIWVVEGGPVSTRSILAWFGGWIAALSVANALYRDQHLYLWGALGLTSAIAMIIGVHRNRPRRLLPWYLLAGSLLAQALGDATLDVLVGYYHEEDPFPSVGDLFYLGMYVLIAAGMVRLYRLGVVRRDPASLIDALILTSAVGLVLWIYLIGPYIADPTLTLVYLPHLDYVLQREGPPSHGATTLQVRVTDAEAAEAKLLRLALDDPQATVIEFGRTRQNLEAIFLQIVEGGTTPS